MGALLIWFVFWSLVGGLVGFAIGNGKGRGAAGFWLGFFLGFIGWIIVACMSPTVQVQAAQIGQIALALQTSQGDSSGMDRRACPYCAESIKAAARVCRFCGRDVDPAAIVPQPKSLGAQQGTAITAQVLVDDPELMPGERARLVLEQLTAPPVNPELWLRTVADRIAAGEEPAAAAATVPLNLT